MQEIFDIVFHILFWPCFVYASYYALMAIVFFLTSTFTFYFLIY